MRQDIAMKYNRRIYPVYKGIGWDPLFYSAIIFLFLTQVKGLEATKVLYAESACSLFGLLLQIPITILIEKLGSRKSVIIGNILMTTQIIMMIFVKNFAFLLLAYIILALGSAMKDISECTILYDATKMCKRKNSLGNIDAKGSSASYALQAITSILAGYFFIINPYIPLILSALISFLTVIIACRFEEVEQKKRETTIKQSVRDMKEGFGFILNSKRLRSLLIFISLFVGVLMMISTYEKSLLKDLGVKAQYFGIIFAMLTMVQCFSVQYQNKIHNKFKNKTLAFLSIPIFISFMLIGVIANLNLNHVFQIIAIIFMFAIQHFLRSPYWVLENKYITNFTTPDIRVKILSAKKIMSKITRMSISFLAGLLLEYYTTSQAYFLIGLIGLIVVLLLLKYMNSRVGLAPEQYDKKDIEYGKISNQELV